MSSFIVTCVDYWMLLTRVFLLLVYQLLTNVSCLWIDIYWPMNVPRTVISEGPSVAFISSPSAGPYFAKWFKKIDKMCWSETAVWSLIHGGVGCSQSPWDGRKGGALCPSHRLRSHLWIWITQSSLCHFLCCDALAFSVLFQAQISQKYYFHNLPSLTSSLTSSLEILKSLTN